MNILHLLYTSLPIVSGYGIRTENILKTLTTFKINNYPLVYENIINNYPFFRYNGIKYYQYNTILRKSFLNKIPDKFETIKKIFKNFLLINETIFRVPHRKISNIIEKNKINLIHGYSPYYFSQFGEMIKEKKGIPFIYEKRGFFELTNLTEGIYNKNSLLFRWDRFNENRLLRKADKIITLSNQMKKEIVKMGINSEKIQVIYNCVNSNEFIPSKPNKNLIMKFNLKGKRIIGYVGNIRKLEGIEYLLKAFSNISNKFKDLIVLLVGKIKIDLKLKLEKLIYKLGIKNKVIFTGVVPYKDIIDYYSLFEIIIIPRINAKVCNLVTPQKPLEIMAVQKFLLVSDVKGLTEIVKPGISGDIFKTEDIKDLTEKISYYLENPEEKKQIEEKSREFILRNFTCEQQYKKYVEIYESLL